MKNNYIYYTNITLFVLFLSIFSLKAQDTWLLSSPTGEIPDACIGHSMVSIGNKIYLFGGMNNAKSIFNHISVYDCEQQWVKVVPATSNKPSQRYNHKAVGYNNKMYVFFGFDGTNKLGDTWYYDVINNEWHELMLASPKPVARTEFSINLVNDMIWISGGLDNNGNILNDLWAFNLSNDTWEQYPPLNTNGLYGHIAGFGNPLLLLLGGYDENGLNTQMYCFDIGNYNWTTATAYGNVPQPATNQCFIPYSEDIAFVYSGFGSNGILNNLYKWNLNTNSFTQLSAGPSLEYTAGSFIKYSQDKFDTFQNFVFFGGSDGTNIMDGTWIYTSDIQITSDIDEYWTNNINIYPNPASNYINIETTYIFSDIYIFNSLGQIVYQSNIVDNNTIINISFLPAGFYNVLFNANNKIISKKFIVFR